MNAQEIISSGILEMYCMGQASAKETADVLQWVKQYPEVAAELDAIQAGLEKYARANSIKPDDKIKQNIFEKINASVVAAPENIQKVKSSSNGKVRHISSFWKTAAAASIILLIGSLIFNYTLYNKYQDGLSQLAKTEYNLEKQKDITNAMAKDMGVMANKDAVPVSLNPMPDVADAAARIYWMKNNGEVYIDPSNLPQAPKGKQYQFWGIVDGVPVSGGMINTNIEIDGKKVHIQKMKSFGRAQAFAISIEDAGPEKSAPSKVIVMGKI